MRIVIPAGSMKGVAIGHLQKVNLNADSVHVAPPVVEIHVLEASRAVSLSLSFCRVFELWRRSDYSPETFSSFQDEYPNGYVEPERNNANATWS